MTSIASESVATILCSCKQTRFHIDNPNYREVCLYLDKQGTFSLKYWQLDVEGLNITVTSGEKTADKKGKARFKGDGVEILSNAKLRLKAGQRYALIGRNGSGKSSKNTYRIVLPLGLRMPDLHGLCSTSESHRRETHPRHT